MSSETAKTRRFNALPEAERLRLLATGRLTVRVLHQMVNGDFVTRYMPQTRGIGLRTDGGLLYDSREEALAAGRKRHAEIKAAYAQAGGSDAQAE